MTKRDPKHLQQRMIFNIIDIFPAEVVERESLQSASEQFYSFHSDRWIPVCDTICTQD